MPFQEASASGSSSTGAPVQMPRNVYPTGDTSYRSTYLWFLSMPVARISKHLCHIFIDIPSATRDHISLNNWNNTGDLFGLRRFPLVRLRCVAFFRILQSRTQQILKGIVPWPQGISSCDPIRNCIVSSDYASYSSPV